MKIEDVFAGNAKRMKTAHRKLIWFCVRCYQTNTLSKWDRRRLEREKHISIKCNVCKQRGVLELVK